MSRNCPLSYSKYHAFLVGFILQVCVCVFVFSLSLLSMLLHHLHYSMSLVMMVIMITMTVMMMVVLVTMEMMILMMMMMVMMMRHPYFIFTNIRKTGRGDWRHDPSSDRRVCGAPVGIRQGVGDRGGRQRQEGCDQQGVRCACCACFLLCELPCYGP